MIFRNTNIGQISFFGKWKDNFEAVLICLFDDCFTPKNISSNLQKIPASLKGIIRKECQSFTNHGHAKTPPTVFNPPSLWLTLPRDMGVSHTLWPPSITRAILACLWFAQVLHKAQKKIKTAEPFYDVQGDSMYESTWKSRFWKTCASQILL